MATKKQAERYSIFRKSGKRCGGAEQYGAAASKRRSVLGRAADTKCACGAPAVAWVLRADTPEAEIRVAPDRGKTTHTGLIYSMNPAHYRAACSDHRKAEPEPAPRRRSRKAAGGR